MILVREERNRSGFGKVRWQRCSS